MKRIVTKTTEEFVEATSNVFNWNTVSLDIETARENGLNFYKAELIGFSIYDGETAIYADNPNKELLNLLNNCLNKCNLVIMHNAVYDMKILRKYGVVIDTEIFDTLVASHLLDENRVDKRLNGKGHGLKVLAEEYLGADVIKYEQAQKAGEHSELFYEYAQNDAIWTAQLCSVFLPRLREEDLEELFRSIEMPFVKTLAIMEANGIQVDKEKLQTISEQAKDKLVELEVEMLKEIQTPYEVQYDLLGGMTIKSDINFGSSKQMAELLFDRLGLPVIETTNKGARSVGKLTINTLKGKNKFVALLAKYRQLQKLKNSFIDSLPQFVDADGRARPNFHNTGTVTGRLSSSKFNAQQLPKAESDPLQIRSCFVAPEGKKLIALDYSQQELRIMAELSNDEKLIHIINNEGDLHLINANLVFKLGLPEEELYETHPNYSSIKKAHKKDRDKGKIFSFGIPYGMGQSKLAKDFAVSLQEAEVLLRNFFEGFPQLESTIKKVHEEAQENLYVRTFVGRRRHFTENQWGKLDNKSLRQSFNFLIQGFGADLIRMSCVAIQEYADKNPQYGIRLLLTVHDEIVIECHTSCSKKVADECKRLMETVYEMKTVPLIASYGIGDNYAEAK